MAELWFEPGLSQNLAQIWFKSGSGPRRAGKMIGQNDSANFLPYHFALSFFRPWRGSGSILAQMVIPAWFKLVQLVQMGMVGSTRLARPGGPRGAYCYEKSV